MENFPAVVLGTATGSGVGPFLGTWYLSGTETFTHCVGDAASASATDPFSGAFTWTAGGAGLTAAGGCTFDEVVSGTTATLAAPLSCGGPISGGGEETTAFETFTWVLGADGTTATISQTGTQQFTSGGGGMGTCQVAFALTATRE